MSLIVVEVAIETQPYLIVLESDLRINSVIVELLKTTKRELLAILYNT